jgi:peptidoglycan/LPS O-acetylase OafA/YrhL
MRRSIGRKLLVILFVLLALNGFFEAIRNVASAGDEPLALFWLQLGAGSLALASAVGLWRGARWAPVVLALWGIEAAAMVVSIGPILDLDAQASAGLWPGAACILVIAGLCAWYARRTAAR